MALSVLCLAVLACTGSQLAMQIVDAPAYLCPTPVVLTATPYPTFPPIPGYPTLVPLPTPPPPPTVTPYAIQSPGTFYLGDAVFAGGAGSAIRARFRLISATSSPATPFGTLPSSVFAWTLEIRNVGATPYEVFPAWQSYVSRIATDAGSLEGIWGVSQDAALEAGISPDFAAVSLAAGDTGVFALAAYGPQGAAERITFMLDPVTDSGPTPLPGTARPPGVNPLVWTTVPNPYCAGDIADPS